MANASERFLCIASYEKGHDFLRECAELGVKPTLLTLDKLRDAAWPTEAIEDLITMPPGLNRDQILNTVSWMARGRRFDRIVALDEFDLETAAQIREHMRIPGMGTTTSAYYRDKLAMRVGARSPGFLVPEFCRVLNYDELREYMDAFRRPGCSSPAPRPRRWESAKSSSRKSFGAPSTTWETARAISCWSNSYPAKSSTSIPSSTAAKWSFPWCTNMAGLPCR